MAFWILGMGTGIQNHIPAFWEWERNGKIKYQKFSGINGNGWEFHKKIHVLNTFNIGVTMQCGM